MGTYVADEGWARYRARAAQHESLSSEQEAALASAWRAGDERAGARLIACNLRHVVAIAAEYRRWGVPCDDLVQEGSIGLLKAARRFDPTLDCSLKAYASYWIRAELRDYVVRGYRIVRLGTTRTERRALRAFRTTNVESAEQLAERSGMPHSRCMLLWPLLSHGDQSLDTAPASGVPARERLRDECPDPESVALRHESAAHASARVKHALSALSDRERRIVWARMAVDEPETLEQIGKRLGVSRERVRQLESRAKLKLKDALSA